MPGFQNTTPGSQMAPGVEGGFYGDNPLFTLTNPDEGQFVVGTGTVTTPGVIIGRFAWANTATGLVTSAHPGVSTVRVGFVHKDQPAYFSGILTQYGFSLTQGQGVDLLEDGPMWGRFAAGCSVGQKVYTSYADSSLRAAATATPATATGVTWTQNNSVNVTVVAGGTLYPGQPVSGTGIPAGTFVVSYNAAAATAVLSAATTGGAASANAVTQTLDFETLWTTRSACLSGEIAKLSVRG